MASMRPVQTRCATAIACLILAPMASAEVTIDWITVGDPRNACDTQSQGCFGEVPYEYKISKFETTNADYVKFLNAVAKTDPNELYDERMGSGESGLDWGGIFRNGSDGNFSYSIRRGRGNWGVNYVSFFDAARYANWLHNGQPIGPQDATTTEDGAYPLTAPSLGNGRDRLLSGSIFVPTEDEWYKAAYYDGPTDTYFAFPTRSNTEPFCGGRFPHRDVNVATCRLAFGNRPNDVGIYSNATSPYGTYDQGGNMFELTDTFSLTGNPWVRGGSFNAPAAWTSASFRSSANWYEGTRTVGFRVVNAVLKLPIDVDIKPHAEANSINLTSQGVIPVAILGSSAFDVLDVDTETLAFGPAGAIGAAPAHPMGGHLADVNDDGFTDLLSHYRTQETGIAVGDTEACVVGETLDGTPFEGCDSILVLGVCGLGYELALLVPGLMWLRQRRRTG